MATAVFYELPIIICILDNGYLGNVRQWQEMFRISKVFGTTIIDYDSATLLLECTQIENRNDDLVALLKRMFANRIEIVRGGSVAVEAFHALVLHPAPHPVRRPEGQTDSPDNDYHSNKDVRETGRDRASHKRPGPSALKIFYAIQ